MANETAAGWSGVNVRNVLLHLIGVGFLLTQNKLILAAEGVDKNLGWFVAFMMVVAVAAFVAGGWHAFRRPPLQKTAHHFVITAWVFGALIAFGS